MKNYSITLSVIEFPDNFKRGEHVLILLQNSAGEYVLGDKDIYPKGISRMLGGGMDKDEDPATAAARELAEETALFVNPEDLTTLAKVTAHVTNATDESITFTIYIYFYNLGDQPLAPQDDIRGVTNFTEEAYYELLHRYEQLPKAVPEKLDFSWYDYGQLYSFIHRLAINEVRSL